MPVCTSWVGEDPPIAAELWATTRSESQSVAQNIIMAHRHRVICWPHLCGRAYLRTANIWMSMAKQCSGGLRNARTHARTQTNRNTHRDRKIRLRICCGIVILQLLHWLRADVLFMFSLCLSLFSSLC